MLTLSPMSLLRRPAARTVLRAFLVFFSFFLTLLAAEVVLRVTRGDVYAAATEMAWFREDPEAADRYVVDPEFGFRPRLDGGLYSSTGTMLNAYDLEHRQNHTRILFAGDSVTALGFLIDGLRKSYGEEDFEYWNGGVHSFNTEQQVLFYERYQRTVKPDVIVLTFHINDFEVTPVAFRDARGNLNVWMPGSTDRSINPILWRWSHIYRLVIGMLSDDVPPEEKSAPVREALARFARLAAEDGADLRMVFHPVVDLRENWTEEQRVQRKKALSLFQDFDLPAWDLTPVVEEMIEEHGTAHVRFFDIDPYHHSKEAGLELGAWLAAEGLLDVPEQDSD